MFPMSSGNAGQYGSFFGMYPPLVPYGTLNLSETSPPQSFTEPVELADAISFLHLPPSTPERSTISGMISAARVYAETMQNRDLVEKQWDMSLDYWSAFRIELRDPLISVDLVEYQNSDGDTTAMVEDTDYVVDKSKHPGAILPPYPRMIWPVFVPWPSSAILIRFTSGLSATSPWWAETGASVKVGMKQLISGWFNGRIPYGTKADELPFGVTSLLSFGAIRSAK